MDSRLRGNDNRGRDDVKEKIWFNRIMKTPSLIWPTFWTIAAFATLVCLGLWQLQRLEWKNALIAELEAAYAADPHQTFLTSEKLTTLPEGKIVRGTLQGIANPSHLTWLEMRPCNKGQLGSDALLPVKTADGYAWLNLGCVTAYHREAVDSMITNRRSLIPVDIVGIALAPQKAPFKPENKPEKNEWYQFDAAAMAAPLKIDEIAPVLVVAEESLAKSRTEITPYSEKIMPQNNHLAYAIFWLVMSLVLWVIYYLRFIRAKTT